VRKHAKATNVELAIQHRDGRLLLTVADDGRGFDPATRTPGEFPRFGLPTMRERAESVGGRLDVESAPGRGTSIRLEVPIAEA
jgi:signal transduction histidine kinase